MNEILTALAVVIGKKEQEINALSLKLSEAQQRIAQLEEEGQSNGGSSAPAPV